MKSRHSHWKKCPKCGTVVAPHLHASHRSLCSKKSIENNNSMPPARSAKEGTEKVPAISVFTLNTSPDTSQKRTAAEQPFLPCDKNPTPGQMPKEKKGGRCLFCRQKMGDALRHVIRECRLAPWEEKMIASDEIKRRKRRKILLTHPEMGAPIRKGGRPVLQGGLCDGRKS